MVAKGSLKFEDLLRLIFLMIEIALFCHSCGRACCQKKINRYKYRCVQNHEAGSCKTTL